MAALLQIYENKCVKSGFGTPLNIKGMYNVNQFKISRMCCATKHANYDDRFAF